MPGCHRLQDSGDPSLSFFRNKSSTFKHFRTRLESQSLLNACNHSHLHGAPGLSSNCPLCWVLRKEMLKSWDSERESLVIKVCSMPMLQKNYPFSLRMLLRTAYQESRTTDLGNRSPCWTIPHLRGAGRTSKLSKSTLVGLASCFSQRKQLSDKPRDIALRPRHWTRSRWRSGPHSCR